MTDYATIFSLKLISICIVTLSLSFNFIFIELGPPLFTVYKEKFIKLDNEKRLKETEVVEGGYLELGFTLFLIRFKVIEKDNDSCIIKSTIEYDVKEEAANASYVTIDAVANIAELSKNYLTKNKAAKDEH